MHKHVRKSVWHLFGCIMHVPGGVYDGPANKSTYVYHKAKSNLVGGIRWEFSGATVPMPIHGSGDGNAGYG
jgi:hypothetical protein